MTHVTEDRFRRLSETEHKVRSPRSDFKIGDVVESINSMVAPKDSKGIVILEYVEDGPPDYDVYWYSSEMGSVFRGDLKSCSGTENNSICMQCRYKHLCPNLDEIVRCDISEFAEWRTEGELDFSICKKRKCKHLSVCLLENWLPRSV